MMRIAVVEDNVTEAEKLNDFLERILTQYGREYSITVFGDGNGFFEKFQKDSFEILFMDIQLPDINGIDICKRVRERDERVTIVFVTNMAHRAIDGYSVEATDFLIKPLEFAAFSLKMKRIMRYIDMRRDKKIEVSFKDSTLYVDESDIVYVEVVKHYIIFHTSNGDYTLRGSMKETKNKFSSKFEHSSTRFLVNLEYVEKIMANQIMVRGKGQVKPAVLPLTRIYKNSFTKALSAYVSGLR